jgi:hypothetical protein
MAPTQIWRHVRNPAHKRPMPAFRTVFGLLVAVLLIAIFLLAAATIRMGAAGAL